MPRTAGDGAPPSPVREPEPCGRRLSVCGREDRQSARTAARTLRTRALLALASLHDDRPVPTTTRRGGSPSISGTRNASPTTAGSGQDEAVDRPADSSPTLSSITEVLGRESSEADSGGAAAERADTELSARSAHDGDFVSLRTYFEDPANRAPRATPATVQDQSAAGLEPPVPSVLNPETGKIRVMSGKCTTCIGRPGTCLSSERRRELLGLRPDGTYDEGWTVCHSTLPGNPDGLEPAVCAWIAAHPQAAPRSLAMRVGAAHGIEYVDPLAKP